MKRQAIDTEIAFKCFSLIQSVLTQHSQSKHDVKFSRLMLCQWFFCLATRHPVAMETSGLSTHTVRLIWNSLCRGSNGTHRKNTALLWFKRLVMCQQSPVITVVTHVCLPFTASLEKVNVTLSSVLMLLGHLMNLFSCLMV